MTDPKLKDQLLELQNQVGALEPIDNSQEAILLRRQLKKVEAQILASETTETQELEEVEVTGEASKEVKKALKGAEEFKAIPENTTAESEKTNIALKEFNLKNIGGVLQPDLDREQYFPIKKDAQGNELSWQGKPLREGRAKFKNDYDTDLKLAFGSEEKANRWKGMLEAAKTDGVTLNEDNIDAYFDLTKVSEETKNEVVSDAKRKKSEVFLRDYGPKQRNIIKRETLQGRNLKSEEKDLTNQYDDFTKDYDVFSETKGILDSDIKNYNKERETLENKIKNFSVNDNPTVKEIRERNTLNQEIKDFQSKDIYSELNKRWEDLNGQRAAINERLQLLNDKSTELGDLNVMSSALSKSYELGDRFSLAMEEAFLGAPAMLGGSILKGVGDVGLFFSLKEGYSKEAFQEHATNAKWYRDLVAAKTAAVDYNQRLGNIRKNTLPERLKTGEGKGSDYWGEMLMDNSPSILTAFGTMGYTGLATAGASGIARATAVKQATNLATGVFFTMEAGGQMSALEIAQRDAPKIIASLENELKTAEGSTQKNEILKQIEDQKNTLNLSQWRKSLNSVAYGGIASLAERFGTLKFVGDFNKYSKAIGRTKLEKFVSPSVARVVSKGLGVTRGVGIGAGIELIEEGPITQVGHNFSDIVLLNQNKSLIEGIDKEFVKSTLATSLAISGPSMSQNLYSAFANEVKLRSEAKEEGRFRDELLSVEKAMQGLDKRTKPYRDLWNKKQQIIAGAAALNSNIVLKTERMDVNDIETVFNNGARIRELISEGKELGSDLNIDDYTKSRSEDIQKEAQTLFDTNQKILGKEQEAYERIFSGAPNPVEAITNKTRFENGKSLVRGMKGIDLVEINDAENLNTFLEKSNFTPKQEEAIRDNFAKGTPAINIGNKAIVFNSKADFIFGAVSGLEAKIASASVLHEVGHIQTRKAGIIKDNKLAKEGSKLVENIMLDINNRFLAGKLSKENYKIFEDRMQRYKEQNDGEIDADELLQLVGDFQFLNILPRSSFAEIHNAKTFVNLLLKKFNGDHASFFGVETANDAYNFVTSWQQKAISQETTGEEEDEQIKTVKPSLSKTQQAASEKALGNIDVKDINTAKSKNIIGTALIGMAEAQIKNRLSLDSNVTEEMKFDLVERTLKDLNKNPWNGKGSLSGYIGQRIKFSLQDIFTDEYKKAPENRLYINQIDNKQLEDFRAQSKIDEGSNNAKPEAKQFKKIKDSKIFSPDVITSIENKLTQTVRVLKSKIDTKTTINKSVKPVIAEIKKEMGKQADIDIKTAVGTMDTNLKRNFLKAKKATLENAPTTWLATSMPFAVQKSVGGAFTDQPIKDEKGNIVAYVFKPKYTGDWQGKEIDRVKTSTGAAGNTSGNQFIRRLPNVNQNVTDEQFMSYLLPDGKKLKAGRKESWSKMMGEEIAFEIFDEELNNPESELTKAFEKNQKALSVTLADNYVETLQKDIERGTVKSSIAPAFVEGTKYLFKQSLKKGVDEVIDKNGNPLINFADGRPIDKEAARYVRRAFDKSLIQDFKVLAYLQSVKFSSKIPKDVINKVGKALTKNSDKILLDNFAKDMRVVANLLGSDITDIIGFDGLGFFNRLLDSAETKKDDNGNIIPGAKGKYFDFLNKTKDNQPKSKDLPDNLDLSLVSPINSKFGVMAKVARILESPIKAEEKLQKYEKFIGEIDAANLHNKILAKHIIGKLVDAVKTNKIKPESLIYMLQAQTNATKGLRSLTGFKYITFKDGDQGNQKGEHLADNAGTMFEIAELAFTEGSDLKTNNEIDNILEYHDQWLENRDLLDVIDIFGKNNPFKDLRMMLLTESQLRDVYTHDGKLAIELIAAREEAIKIKVRAQKKLAAKPKKEAVVKSSIAPDLSKGLNEMIARQKGVKPEAVYSKVVARKKGVNKGKYKFFLPSTAEDFRGLTQYTFAGKGKQGDADQKFFEDNLVKPYLKGISAMESQKQALKNDYSGLLKSFPKVKKILNKEIAETGFTNDQAVRIYLYNKSGFEVPGISKRDKNALLSAVNNSPDLKGFADTLQIISQRDQWVEPSEFWDVGSVLKDLNELSENVSRKDYLEEFITNVDQIFNEDNLNKVEAMYGSRHREALEDIIRRMKSGSNRPGNPDRLTGAWLDWVNNSVGTIMFFNRRSALLQMLSFTNFVNWSDNNPLMAAKAFANQPAYWSAWAKIFNSDKLKQRRGGLKSDVQEQEIANQAKSAKDKYSAAVSYLLKIGFTPTQIADSMAIATGGATFLINRTNTYVKQGMSKADAEAKAFEDFSAISDETQQSGDPMLISKQQSSHLGRLILAFQNTPMQYTRLMKKAGQDLINRRGDAKTNISKIIYYGFVQNLIFSTLQNALFALLPEFDPDDEDEEKFQKVINTKQERIMNSMVDTILRGSGLAGAVVSTLKNTINEYYRQEEKGSFMADHAYTLLQLANISPPIGSKLRKVYGAIQTKNFDSDVIDARGAALDSPGYEVIGNLLSAGLNIPLDRAVSEIRGITEALDDRNTAYQRLALGLGWRTWDVNAKNEEHELIKTTAKKKRKEEGKIKAAETRKENKKLKLEILVKLSKENQKEYKKYLGLSTKDKNAFIRDEIKKLKNK